MIKAIKHSWLTVIMLIVVCMALFIGYTELFVEDQYESKYIIKSSLQYKTVKKVLTSHATYKAIDDQTGETSGTTKKSLTITKNDNEIIILVATNQAILSKKIADGVIVKLQSAYPGRITIIQAAQVNNNPTHKTLINNTIIGCVIGLILGVAYTIILYFYNRN